MLESIQELKGILVVDLEQGALLGAVTGMTVDLRTATIDALVYEAKGGQLYSVPRQEVQKIGRDVVLLKPSAGEAIDRIEDAPGVSLKELQGCWVTTLEGKHLGTLVDIDFSPADWQVSELELSERKRLPVAAETLKIGDEILVPAGSERTLKDVPRERYGVMGRLFGQERIDDLRHAMGRAFRKKDGQGSTTQPDVN